MIYRWTIELRVDVADIQIAPGEGETWYALACRDISDMDGPGIPFAAAVTILDVLFGPSDPRENDEADERPDE